MKRLRTILLLFGILSAGGIILLLTPRLWQDKIEIVLNKNFLSSKGWQISIGTIKGHLFSTVIMEDILLWHQDGSNVLSNEVSSKINLPQMEYLKPPRLYVIILIRLFLFSWMTHSNEP